MKERRDSNRENLSWEDHFITEIATRIHEALHAFPPSSLFRWRQRIWMLTVIAEMRPTRHVHQQLIDSLRFQIAKLFCTFVKSGKTVIF